MFQNGDLSHRSYRSIDPIPGQLGIGIGHLNASGGVAFQHGRQHRCPGTGKGVQDMAARLCDLHDVLHELQRLFREMDAVLRISVLEHTGQTRYRTVDGHISVGAPDDVLCLLAEAPLLRAAVALIPNCGASPDPTGPLESVCRRGKLPPVDEHTHWGTELADLSRFIQPLSCPAGPGALVLGVPVKGRRSICIVQ